MTDYQHDNDGTDHFVGCRPLEKDVATEATEPTDTEIKVWEIIGLLFGDHYSPNRFCNSANIVEDLGADNLDQVELVMGLEEGFAIEIDDCEFYRAETVQCLINLVENKL